MNSLVSRFRTFRVLLAIGLTTGLLLGTLATLAGVASAAPPPTKEGRLDASLLPPLEKSSVLSPAFALDPTFGTVGIQRTDLGGNDQSHLLLVDANVALGDLTALQEKWGGPLLVQAGMSEGDLALLKRNRLYGSLDPTFGTGGVARHEMPGEWVATAAAIPGSGAGYRDASRWAAFAHAAPDQCVGPELTIASGVAVTGSVHSNGDLGMSGAIPVAQGQVTYVGGCTDCRSSYPPTATLPLPFEYPSFVEYRLLAETMAPTFDQYYVGNLSLGNGARLGSPAAPISYIEGDLEVAGDGVILTGLIFVRGNVRFSGDQTSGSFSLVTQGQVDLSLATNLDGHYYYDTTATYPILAGPHAVLFYTNAVTDPCQEVALRVTGASQSLMGNLFASRGRAEIGGSGNRLLGSVVAPTVRLTGTNNVLTHRYDLFPQQMPDLLLGGTALISGTRDFAITSLYGNGALNPAFAAPALTVDIAGGDDELHGLALSEAPGGTPHVAAGRAEVNGLPVMALIGFYENPGRLADGFGTGGVVTLTIGGLPSEAFALVASRTTIYNQPRGYLAAGRAGEDWALALYGSNGVLQNGFGGNGVVTTSLGAPAAIQALYALTGTGYLAAGHAGEGVALARYALDGSLDATFGQGGITRGDFGPGPDTVREIQVQPDGTIWLIGHSGGDGVLARYLADGTPDTTLGVGGMIRIDWGGTDEAVGLTWQPDGKIIVAGTSDAAGDNDFVLARYAPTVAAPLTLAAGWNSLALPIHPATPLHAAGFCALFNEQGGGVMEINRWHAGGWDSHLCGLPFNNFPIEWGRGYLVRSEVASSATLVGVQPAASIRWSLDAAWNNISLPFAGYSAETLCQAFNRQGAGAVEIVRWVKGGWDGHLCGLPFNDFPITLGQGYFIRLTTPGSYTISAP